MATPIPWPYDRLRPAKITRHIAARTVAGTVAASGFTQRVAVPAATWNIQYDGIVIASAADLHAWDALAGALDGGANPVMVPLVGDGNPPDGTAVSDAALGATSIVISRTQPILPGMHFSHSFGGLYRVIRVDAVAGSNYTLTIRPPIRISHFGVGDTAHFTLPQCKCRLKTDDEMILDIDSARIGMGKVQFVEDPVP